MISMQQVEEHKPKFFKNEKFIKQFSMMKFLAGMVIITIIEFGD